MTSDRTLWFRDRRVGTIRNVTCHQGTWFGDLHHAVDPDAGDGQRRVVEFIEFRQDWNERAEEADAYRTSWWPAVQVLGPERSAPRDALANAQCPRESPPAAATGSR